MMSIYNKCNRKELNNYSELNVIAAIRNAFGRTLKK